MAGLLRGDGGASEARYQREGHTGDWRNRARQGPHDRPDVPRASATRAVSSNQRLVGKFFVI